MRFDWFFKLSPFWQTKLIRWGFNWHPAFRRTGGRVVYVSPDLQCIRVRLRLNWLTRNIVGSLYGGSLYAVTDGPHPLMLMIALGSNYIVWDKSASIRYRKPGYTTLYADMGLPAGEVVAIQRSLEETSALERVYTIELKDKNGEVYTTIERTVYIAEKSFYRGQSRGKE